ncbi:hypothetical protein HDZ31DRAFT_31706 [Schizophyllum fasciatum]
MDPVQARRTSRQMWLEELYAFDNSHLTTAGRLSPTKKMHKHKVHPTAYRPHNAVTADVNPTDDVHGPKDKGGHAYHVTDVPEPVPDTGMRPTQERDVDDLRSATHESMPHFSSHSALPTTTIYPSAHFTTPAHSFMNLHTMSSASSSSITSSSSPTATTVPQHPTHNISAAIISLCAVGAACALVVAILLARWFSRPPKRRQHPTPSLPILQDPFRDEESMFGKEADSPLFGGKERGSPEVGSNGQLWTWTQYNQAPAVVLPVQAVTPREAPSPPKYSFANEKNQAAYPAAPPMPPPAALASFQYPAPVQQVSNAITRAVNRLSAASLSIYPASPQIPAHEVGVAIDCSSGNGFTGGDTRPLRRAKSKTSLSKNRLSVATTHLPRESTMLAYEGSDIGSPTMTEVPPMPALPSSASSSGGRHRVKSSYFSGPYPRSSSVPHMGASSEQEPPLPTHVIHKAEPRKERDTRALAMELGLASPMTEYPTPASPHDTVYPDDSFSVAPPRRAPTAKRARRQSRARAPAVDEPTSPAPDASASLGSLMLMDARASLYTLAGEAQRDDAGRRAGTGAGTRGGIGERPPRVPSPPTLPSLAQMGLEHSNPDAFADYRSPTYSIYNLYDSVDRKSRLL